MKKLRYPRLVTVLLLVFIAGNLFAQEIVPLPPVTVTSSSNVSKEVTKSFDKNFKTAVDPHWYKIDKDYFVKFIQDDMKNSAMMKNNGSVVYHIAYGYEKNLPGKERDQVKAAYPGYNITTAIKAEMEGRQVWVVNIENADKLIVLRLEEGEMDEVGNYKKSQ